MNPLQLSVRSEWPYPLRFSPAGDEVLVYDGEGRYSEALTEVYRSVARPSNDSYARSVTTALGHWLAYADRAGLDLHADPVQCRQIYEAVVTDRYKAELCSATKDGATICCLPGSSPHTIASSVANTRVAFEVLIGRGLRKGRNPFLKVRPARSNKADHRRRLLNYINFSHKRTPLAYYKIINQTQVPIFVTDGDTLVKLMRTGGKRARWSQRDIAVFEFLASYGTRAGEVVEATLEEWSVCHFGHEIKVRDKGKGPAPRKIVPLTALAEAAINSYFVNERWKHDKRFAQFSAWAEKRKATYTPAWYARFLKDQGVSLSEEPLFLAESGNSYTREAYTTGAWERARAKAKINPTPHHMRHWYVNKRLRQLEEEFGNDIVLYHQKTMDFVESMGWDDPFSVLYYDHEGRYLKMLKRYRLQPKLMESPKSSAGQELLELAGVAL